MNQCIYLKLKQKKYQKFLYCQKACKKIDLGTCKNCPFKEYKKTKVKRDYNQKSILENCAILLENREVVNCFNYKIYGYHKHHIFGGKNRKNSEKYGLFLWLNPNNHEFSNTSVHKHQKLDRVLKEMAQKAFMKKYPDLDFVSIFGRNYLRKGVGEC